MDPFLENQRLRMGRSKNTTVNERNKSPAHRETRVPRVAAVSCASIEAVPTTTSPILDYKTNTSEQFKTNSGHNKPATVLNLAQQIETWHYFPFAR